jgi:zeta-carotene desaturase
VSADALASNAPHAVVVGGGYAGIAAAVALARRGARVTLLESRRQWGGRATSWPDPKSGDVVDNGQHVFLGCYAETLALLEQLGTRSLVRFPAALRLVLREPGGRETRLDAGRAPGRLGLAWALFTWDRLPLGDRIELARAVALAPTPSPSLTTAEWLAGLGQRETAMRFFWQPLVEAALNERVDRAPAAQLHAVIARAFRGEARAAAVGVATAGLGALVDPIADDLAARGGTARLGVEVRGLVREPNARGAQLQVLLEDATPLRADAVVLAVPAAEAHALAGVADGASSEALAPAASLEGSPIVTVTLWFDAPVLPAPMIGLIAPPAGAGPGFHWVFDRSAFVGRARDGRHVVTLVASAARELASRPSGEILERAHSALELYGLTTRRSSFGRVVKEPKATPAFTPASHHARPGVASSLPGLAFAGDWTRSDLPATIEAAVASGNAAARAALVPRV